MATSRRELRALSQRAARFGVLVVCTGNVARSVLVERLLLGALGGAGISIESAGTRAMVGSGASSEARRVAAAYGVDVDGHAARQVSEEMLRGAGLVLTATRAHKAELLAMSPEILSRAFTVREFSRAAVGGRAVIALRDPVPLRTAALAEYAHQHRSRHAARGDNADDIVDPYGRDDAVQREFERQTVAATQAIIAVLAADS